MVKLAVETAYPWQGTVRVTVEATPEQSWSMFLRIPGWCERAALRVNDRDAGPEVSAGGYAELHRAWRPGDELELELAMPIRQLISHPRVAANLGRVALARGPLVYCIEAADHPGLDIWDLRLPPETCLRTEECPGLLGGVVAIRGKAIADEPTGWLGQLYRSAGEQPATSRQPVELTAIPYYTWGNRSPGPMQVWIGGG
jgi:DUF1680 family protein